MVKFYPSDMPFIQGNFPRRDNIPFVRTMPEMEVQIQAVKTKHPAAHPITRRVCRKDIGKRQGACRHKADFNGKGFFLEVIAQGDAQARISFKDKAAVFHIQGGQSVAHNGIIFSEIVLTYVCRVVEFIGLPAKAPYPQARP